MPAARRSARRRRRGGRALLSAAAAVGSRSAFVAVACVLGIAGCLEEGDDGGLFPAAAAVAAAEEGQVRG